MRRTKYEASIDKRRAVNAAEDAGLIADSMEVRTALLQRVKSGELTLAEAQQELKRIKRAAPKNGLLARNKAWRMG